MRKRFWLSWWLVVWVVVVFHDDAVGSSLKKEVSMENAVLNAMAIRGNTIFFVGYIPTESEGKNFFAAAVRDIQRGKKSKKQRGKRTQKENTDESAMRCYRSLPQSLLLPTPNKTLATLTKVQLFMCGFSMWMSVSPDRGWSLAIETVHRWDILRR